ncbi:tripartite tricarboxylate transporter family receptor [Variibacter gotjawalensis]|uniref:Tripartite tricarboxylate transporter family receptor n=1 Tax=Variibacter gotjawalensis TaxID=1333996 RepID=A0A0S3PUE6_9BRAD|nr:tripartite tricarboxylate transporter substrate binding protein [Variibacter gotjawalensis]NIK49915.1 tripartite-type tricarboxylate transporter receptor subunit TctC [Variibacter gotjawalensis]RZS45914.1 tripartite-type tricarboxylate transporter receptor subunit TctC [Variibacter gotjawalensis]BAT59589.1 tripartite tricarboxylate transporter family receptor [Variibacter gotjawalensis]
MRIGTACRAGMLVLAMMGAAHAQEDYPSRNITLVVPFAAGSGADAVARILAQPLGLALGTNVVVDNKAGANGAIGATFVARAAPDGYTLILTSNTTHAANPNLMKNIAYDPIKDFAPVVRVGNFGYILATGPGAPGTTVPELVAYAKANPGKLSYAYGNATGVVAAEAFKRQTGTDIVKVPYKSTPPALTDLIAGRVAMMFVDLPSSSSHVESGALRALTVTSRDRSAMAPEIKSMKEVGLPEFDITAWAAIFAPAGTPPSVIAKLNTELRKIVDDPAIKKRLAAIGFDSFSSSSEELRVFVADELIKWTALIKDAGMQAE